MENILIGIIVLCLALLARRQIVIMVLILFGAFVLPIYFVSSIVSDIMSYIMKWICTSVIKLGGFAHYAITDDEANNNED